MTRNYYLKSSSYLYSLSFTAQRTNRVSGRGESPEEESSDTVMPPLYAVLVLFSQVYGLLGNIVQPDTLVRAQIGDTVTLPCFYSEKPNDISWYKQPPGQKIQHIAMQNYFETDLEFFNEFRYNMRLNVKVSKGSFNLTVSQVEPSDSATYHCAYTPYRETIFGNGTTLMVMGSASHNRTVALQQPDSESVQPGDSVTLQCTVQTETCAGEHSVYWFRQGSGESPPGIIYTHGTRSDECQRSSGAVSPTQSCVYNFPKRNLSPSDAGTYYCAVATCGEILFGNMTKLNVEGAASNNQVSGEDLASKQSQEAAMTYAALTFTTKKPKVRRNKREVEKETVYSDMRFRDHE